MPAVFHVFWNALNLSDNSEAKSFTALLGVAAAFRGSTTIDIFMPPSSRLRSGVILAFQIPRIPFHHPPLQGRGGAVELLTVLLKVHDDLLASCTDYPSCKRLSRLQIWCLRADKQVSGVQERVISIV